MVHEGQEKEMRGCAQDNLLRISSHNTGLRLCKITFGLLLNIYFIYFYLFLSNTLQNHRVYSNCSQVLNCFSKPSEAPF